MRGKGITILICVMAMIFGIQATTFSGQGEKLSDADNAAIQEMLDNWDKAWIAKDLGAILALYTDQTIEIYPNGITNVGKANMTKRFKGFLPGSRRTPSSVHKERSVSKSLALEALISFSCSSWIAANASVSFSVIVSFLHVPVMQSNSVGTARNVSDETIVFSEISNIFA